MNRIRNRRHSIGAQFAIIFIALMAGAFSLCWIINSVFLKEYYVRSKQSVIENAYRQVNLLFQQNEDVNSEDFDIEFLKICSNNKHLVQCLKKRFERNIQNWSISQFKEN